MTGKEFKVEEDKTGFMKGDTPAILEKAIEQNVWVPMDGAAASDDAKADDAKEIKGVTEDKLPAEPMFEANKDYDKWTVVEYTCIQENTFEADLDFAQYLQKKTTVSSISSVQLLR